MKLEEYTTEFIEQLFNNCLNPEKTYLIYNSKKSWVYTYLLKRDSAASDFKNFVINHEVDVLSDFHLVPSHHLIPRALTVNEISLDFCEAIPFSKIFEGL